MRQNLLLFGCDFFPARKASEINFWQDIVEKFRSSFGEVVIVSINNRPVAREELLAGVTLYNLPPHYWGNDKNWSDPEYSGKRFHRLPMSALYKTVTFLRYIPFLDDIVENHQIGIFHFMRVFGMLNDKLISRHPDCLFTMTVPTHVDRGFPFHIFYHALKKKGFKGMDALIATSDATRQRLHRLGLKDRIEVIPWSSSPSRREMSSAKESGIRSRLQISPDANVVLWSGPLQGTGEAEFRYSLEVARSVSERTNRYHFVFAFKPDALRPAYLRLVEGLSGISLVETSPMEFEELRDQASLFLSPVCNRNRTVAPPLTWIEMMQHGVPVVTTIVDGADELIDNGRNGFMVDTRTEAVELLSSLNEEDLARAGEFARDKVLTQYSIDSIAAAYLRMWAGLRTGNG